MAVYDGCKTGANSNAGSALVIVPGDEYHSLGGAGPVILSILPVCLRVMRLYALDYSSNMVQLQTVSGFFENAAEAQQAVQILLAGGVPGDTIHLSTQPDLGTGSTETLPAPAEAASSSGRFFSSLFGHQQAYGPERAGVNVKINRRPCPGWPGSRCLTVQTRSADEVKQVTALLERGGAGEVTLQNRSAPVVL